MRQQHSSQQKEVAVTQEAYLLLTWRNTGIQDEGDITLQILWHLCTLSSKSNTTKLIKEFEFGKAYASSGKMADWANHQGKVECCTKKGTF